MITGSISVVAFSAVLQFGELGSADGGARNILFLGQDDVADDDDDGLGSVILYQQIHG